MPPFFSIITPSFNARTGLDGTFASVLEQPGGLIEYLIIDGASPDGTRDWLQRQQSPVLRWISEPDSGVYDAMNKGLAMARGEFVYFLGAGDRLQPGVLPGAAEFIAGLPRGRPRFIYGNVRLVAEGGRILTGPYTKRRLCRENICHQAIFYEKSIFDLLGTHELKYRIYSDWAFNLRCFGDDRIAKFYWDRVVCDFEGDGMSTRILDVNFSRDLPTLIRRHLGWFAAFQFQLENKIKRCVDRLRRRTS